MTPLYTATATSTGGRSGRARSEDGALDLALVMPKGLGGPGGEGTNPEQLFAMGYSACFGSALGLIGRMRKVDLGAYTITAKVSIGKQGEGFGLAVELHGHIPGVAHAQAEELMKAAHEVCPYSKATRGNIEVTLTVE
jgi:osmotically inducible protein OsmC